MAGVKRRSSNSIGFVNIRGVDSKWLVSFLALANRGYVHFYSFRLPCCYITTYEPELFIGNIMLICLLLKINLSHVFYTIRQSFIKEGILRSTFPTGSEHAFKLAG